MAEEPDGARRLRQLAGVDRLPEVLDPAALRSALDRHYPFGPRAERVSGSALVDVVVDETGQVASVTAVRRPAGVHAAMVLEERDGTRRRVSPGDHPAFEAAAVPALREVRFSPAIRDGRPVEHTIRMTIFFDPPAESAPPSS